MTDDAMIAIGVAVQSEDAAAELVALGSDVFDEPQDREITDVIAALLREGLHADLYKVSERTGHKYAEYLVDCLTKVPSPIYAREAVATIGEAARRRRVQKALDGIRLSVDDQSQDVDEIIARVVAEANCLAKREATSATMADAVKELVAGFDNANKPRACFGLPILDRVVGGMQGGRLYVLGARPATGKSALAMSAAVSTSNFGPVLFCSYEMKKDEIAGRIMSNLSGVSSSNIANRVLSNEEYQRLLEFYPHAIKLPIRYPEGQRTVAAVKAAAADLKKQEGLRLIVIDYLQQMSSGQRAESRRVEVGQISRGLKELSMELDVPVLALSQLNRISEATQSRVPTMAEMRDSGDIEQDADVIVLMFRPRSDNDDDEQDECTTVKMVIEKNRQGKSGTKIAVAFDGGRMRFRSLSEVAGK